MLQLPAPPTSPQRQLIRGFRDVSAGSQVEERATRIVEVYDTIRHTGMAQRGCHDSLAVAEHAGLEQTNRSTKAQNSPKARKVACTLVLMSKDTVELPGKMAEMWSTQKLKTFPLQRDKILQRFPFLFMCSFEHSHTQATSRVVVC